MSQGKLLKALTLIAACTLVGCGSKGMIRASEVDAAMRAVASRHDAYVAADQNLSDTEKATYTRSSEIVVRVLDAAKQP